MKRVKRLQPVGQLMDERERESAQRVAAAQGRLNDAQQRHAELQRYLEEYRQMFEQRARAGIDVSGMRDYQVFMARLVEAVQAQQGVVDQLTAECHAERAGWKEAVVRRDAVNKVIARARSDEQRAEERHQQRELDERAQRRGAP